MRRINWPTIEITSTDVRFAIVFALAATVFLNLAVVYRAKTSKVAEGVGATRPAANDIVHMSSPGLASWRCADVAITGQCGGAESAPRCDSIECLIRHAFTSEGQ